MLSSSPTAASPTSHAFDETPPSLNAIVCFLAPREFYRQTIVSTREVFCGPDCQTRGEQEHYDSIQCAPGSYDLREVVSRLPASQRPELILVKADSTGRNQPRHLDAFDCPKILLVGDTHHMQAPLRNILRYAREERFDHLVFDHTRQHAHLFVEAGFDNVWWIPAFDLSPHEQPWRDEVDRQVAFVGQAGRHHPYRRYVLDALAREGVTVAAMTAPPDQAAAVYARSLINLNCSLNGDLNLRVFEVLSSGGFLLNDRLSPQAGLDRLFRDGEHLVCYDGVEDLRQKVEHYLAHPAAARRIARAGRDQYLAHHRPAQKIAELMAIIGGRPSPHNVIAGLGRATRGAGPAPVLSRVALYEHLQELHRTELAPVVMFTDGISPRAIADAADLPRLRILIERAPGAEQVLAELALAGVEAHRVSQPGSGEIDSGVIEFDVLVAQAHAIAEGRHDGLFSHADEIVLESELSPPEAVILDARLRRRGFRRTPGASPPSYRLIDEVTIGERHFAAGEAEQATRHFQAALAADPENVRALNNLGVVSHLFGDTPTCLQFLETALTIDRRDPETLLNLAEVKLQTGQADEARRLHGFLEGRSLPAPSLEERRAALRNELAIGPAAPVARTSAGPARRILVINNIFPPQELGGYGRVMQDFSTLLADRGYEVQVLTSDTSYLGQAPAEEPGIARTLRLFGGWRDGQLFQLPADQISAAVHHNRAVISAAIDRWKPDGCLFGNMDFLGAPCLELLLERRIPVLHHLGNQVPGYTVADTPRSPLYRLATASRWLAEHVKKQGYPLDEIVVIYPGARVGDFQMPTPPSRRRLRIAFASLVMPYKGAHVLVAALLRLAQRGIDFHCTLAGGTTQPAFVQKLRDAIQAAGLEAAFEFPGNLGREALEDLYARCNVLVFPSQVEEAFGITPVEAMAAGLAVASTALGGAGEVIEHEVNGLVFSKTSVEELAAMLEGLVQDRARWQRLAEAGQRRAVERFDIERSVDEIERQLTALIAAR